MRSVVVPLPSVCQLLWRERSSRRVADEFRSSSSSINSGAAAVAAGEVFVKRANVVLSGLASRSELNAM